MYATAAPRPATGAQEGAVPVAPLSVAMEVPAVCIHAAGWIRVAGTLTDTSAVTRLVVVVALLLR